MRPIIARNHPQWAAAALLDAIDPAAEVRYRCVLMREVAVEQRERAWSEGYAAAVADVKRAEHEAVDAVRHRFASHAPGGEAWLAAVQRHGGTEYGGEGRARVQVPAEVLARARQARR
jgi:hypothetical protein